MPHAWGQIKRSGSSVGEPAAKLPAGISSLLEISPYSSRRTTGVIHISVVVPPPGSLHPHVGTKMARKRTVAQGDHIADTTLSWAANRTIDRPVIGRVNGKRRYCAPLSLAYPKRLRSRYRLGHKSAPIPATGSEEQNATNPRNSRRQ